MRLLSLLKEAGFSWVEDRAPRLGAALAFYSAFLTGAAEWLSSELGLPAATWQALDLFISVIVITLLFAAVFKILPDARVKWRYVWGGAVLSALLFLAGKYGLAFYLSRAPVVSTYGAAGALVLVLMWVYYTALVLLFGAEFTQVYAQHTGRRIRPASYAVHVERIEKELPPFPGDKADIGEAEDET